MVLFKWNILSKTGFIFLHEVQVLFSINFLCGKCGKHENDRILLMSEGTAECPTQCGELEVKLHYLYCKDEKLKAGRTKLMTTLEQQLKCLQTYPGIIISLKKLLLNGSDDKWWEEMTTSTPVDKLLKETIEQQHALGARSLPKGYLVDGWGRTQKQWEIISNLPQSKYSWGKETVTSIHTYVYESWKLRNDIIHGKSEKSRKAQERQILQERVIALYEKGRANLTNKEKNHFKLPAEIRIKKGTESLRLWTMIVEKIFERRGAARQEHIDEWLLSASNRDCDLFQPKVRKKYNLLSQQGSGGEEAS